MGRGKRVSKTERAKYRTFPIDLAQPDIKYKCVFDGTICIVSDPDEMDALWYGGSFGKGTQSRSQPTLHRSDISDDQAQEVLILMPPEVIHLSWVYGCLEVRSPDGNEWRIDQLWRHFVQMHASLQLRSTQAPTRDFLATYLTSNTFLINFCAYHHFRALGYIVRKGMQFGCDLLLYKMGPALDHASCGVYLVPSVTFINKDGTRISLASPETDLKWADVSCSSRILAGVQKAMRITHVVFEVTNEHLTVDFMLSLDSDPDAVLSLAHIRAVDMRRWVPERTRDEK